MVNLNDPINEVEMPEEEFDFLNRSTRFNSEKLNSEEAANITFMHNDVENAAPRLSEGAIHKSKESLSRNFTSTSTAVTKGHSATTSMMNGT